MKASGNGKGGLKFSPGCLGTLGARVLSGFAKIWHWVAPPPPPSLFSLVSLNSTKSEMRPVLWLQLHLVNEIKSPDNRCKMQRNVPALKFSICQMKSSDQKFIIKLNYLILFQCNTFLLFKEGDNLIWAQAPSCTLE